MAQWTDSLTEPVYVHVSMRGQGHLLFFCLDKPAELWSVPAVLSRNTGQGWNHGTTPYLLRCQDSQGKVRVGRAWAKLANICFQRTYSKLKVTSGPWAHSSEGR